MLRAIPGSFWRHNLGLGTHELPEEKGIFIVNGVNFVGTEITRLFGQRLAVI